MNLCQQLERYLLCLQETIAALASNKTEAQTPDSSNTTSFEQGGSSSSEILAPSKEKSCQDLKEQQLLIAKQNLKDQQLLIAKQKKEKQEEAIAEVTSSVIVYIGLYLEMY